MSNESNIQYAIDAENKITCVGKSWNTFAAENDGSHLAGASVLGRSLWDFIADEETRQIYQRIIQRVRQQKPARFTLRCDGPSCRRLLEMTVSVRPEGAVAFETRVLRLEPREPIALLAQSTLRSDEYLRLCAWCNRINVGSDFDLWIEAEEATKRLFLFERDRMPQLTHGICDACLKAMNWTHETEDVTSAMPVS